MFERPIIQLPLQLTSFIGRGDEIIQIAQRLDASDCHLLTLVGPGGIGKTRLAIEVAAKKSNDFPDGVYFVDLQPVSTVETLVTTIANSIDMRFFGEQPPRVQLLNFLRDRKLLLLIDNFEHLLDGADLLADIIKAASNVKLFVTSREALNVQEEWLWQVNGLQFPENIPTGPIENFSAVRLFTERARRVRADFGLDRQENSVIRICKLVEGMPLALELAASWTKALSCDEIANEIQHGLDFLSSNSRNIPEQHRSMRAVFERSWNRLTDEERAVFPKLSVFRGGFRREAAEAVASASLQTLVGLVDKSFLRVGQTGRYEIHELMRQYGERMLDMQFGEKTEVQDRHCDYYAEFMDNRRIELKGPQQITALDLIRDELDNVLTSWRWAVTHDKDSRIEQSLHSLLLYYQMRSLQLEGELTFTWAGERFKDIERPIAGPLLIGWNFFVSWNQHRFIELTLITKALSLLRTYGTPEETAFALNELCPPDTRPQLAGTAELFQDNLEYFRAQNKTWGMAWSLYFLGLFAQETEITKAEVYFSESARLFSLLGDRWSKTWPLGAMGLLKEGISSYRDALTFYEAHLTICQDIGGRRGMVWSFRQMIYITNLLGDDVSAHKYLSLSIELILVSPSPDLVAIWIINSIADLEIREGRIAKAVQIFAHILEFNRRRDKDQKWEERFNGILEHLAILLPPDEFRQAVKSGKSRETKEFLREYSGKFAPPQQHREQSLIDPLTDRELEVLRLIADGLQNQEIADQLFVVLGTVKTHINAIYRKLDVSNRVQAVTRARELKLL